MDLVKGFHEHFEGLVAEAEVTREQAYALRYEVYCLERGFEPAERFPDRMERDSYDQRAAHAIVRHRLTGYPAGVVRLVLPDHIDPAVPFPIEQFCGHAFDQQVLRRFNIDRRHLGEVSRFAVSRRFKRRPGEAGTIAGVSPNLNYEARHDLDAGRRMFPHISLGIIALLFGMSRQHDIRYWYAVMEPSLQRLLTRFGIHFTEIGPLVDYHGMRQPMIAEVDELREGVRRARPDFYELIVSLGGAEDAGVPKLEAAHRRGLIQRVSGSAIQAFA